MLAGCAKSDRPLPMKHDTARVRLIGCGIFKQEFSLLSESLRASFELTFMDSRLHMNPERLDRLLQDLLAKHEGQATVLAYGDCCPHMDHLCSTRNVGRIQETNCCEILLGSERYREYRKQGVFLLLPEWALHWKSILKKDLGLKTAELARDFMTQTMTRAVYLDTGVTPVPLEELERFSKYSGLPLTIECVGLEKLEAALLKALGSASNNALESGRNDD